MKLQQLAGIRHLLRHPWQLVLSVVGVALGVMVVVAMDLAIESSREAFRISTETVSGRATHQVIGGPSGVPDSLVAPLRARVGVEAAPVVDGYVTSPLLPDRPLRLLGVDPFSEAPFRPWLAGGPGEGVDGTLLLTAAGGVFVGRGTAEALGIGEGDPIPLRGADEPRLVVVGVLDAEDRWSRLGLRDLLVADVSEAQDRLGREGHLDRIDLRLAPGFDDAEALEALRALLPPGVHLQEAGSRQEEMQEMIRAFDLNLTALSLLALIFGIFLIYNAMTFSVVQRRRTLGILRALGTTRGRLLRTVLNEAAVLAVVGTVIGLVGGILLGRGLVRLVTRTISDLYFVISVEGIALPPAALLKGAVLGVAATLLAALPAAWEAGRVSPREAMGRSWAETGAARRVAWAGMGGFVLAAAGALSFFLPSDSVLFSFVGLFGIVLGMGLMVPWTTVGLASLVRPLARRLAGVLGAMAARGVVTALSRTGPAMAALVVAVSVTVGLGVMIQSFRGSVEDWLDSSLQADLYVSTPSVVAARPGDPLPRGLEERVRTLPGVRGVSTQRSVELVVEGRPIHVLVVGISGEGERGIRILQAEEPDDRVLDAFRAGEGVLASEPLAYRRGWSPGDEILLPGEGGTVRTELLGVYRDYASDAGLLMVSRSLFEAHWSDRQVNAVSLFLAPEVDPADVEADIRAAAPGTPLVIRSNAELRQRSLEVFDRTFQVTRVLRALAFLVAFVAVLSALMALQLERTRELGVLRATGMTPGQTGGLVFLQTGIMGVLAGVLALPVGLALAAAMIFVVNRRSFGWTLDMTVPPEFLVQAVALALAGALLAGIHPSWRMAHTSPAEAMRDE
jgi:putative ABC transport system permease protein